VLEWIEGIPPTTVTGPLGGAPYLREATFMTRAALRPASPSSCRCARLRPHPSRPGATNGAGPPAPSASRRSLRSGFHVAGSQLPGAHP
jgi:hypothetical protein